MKVFRTDSRQNANGRAMLPENSTQIDDESANKDNNDLDICMYLLQEQAKMYESNWPEVFCRKNFRKRTLV